MQGTVALRAWRALPSAVRREAVTLARQGVAHPDPSVARVALAAARAAQRWYDVVMPWSTAALAVAILAYRILWPDAASAFPDDLLVIGVLLLAWLVLTLVAVSWRHVRHSVRLEAVGARDVAFRTPVAPPTPLTVAARPRRWGVWIVMGVSYAILHLELRAGWATPWWLNVLGLICTVAIAGPLAWLVIRNDKPPWARRRPRAGQPLLVLDANGIALPHLGLTLPWTQLQVVDVWVLRRPGLSLYLHDGQLGVPVAWMAEPAERVLTVARDYLAAARAATPAGS